MGWNIVASMDSVFAFLAMAMLVPICAQSVAQQCLTEQMRNINPNIPQNPQTGTPEGITMAAFDSICRNFENYVNCFQARLPGSNIPADRFLRLVFTRLDMERAYRGLCTLDLETLRRNVRCLLMTPAVRNCYNNFNQAVNQIVNLDNQNRLPRLQLQDLACNVSVTRYQCETDVYSRCDARTGQIMRDFFFADLPRECRRVTGVRSRYLNVFNTGHALGWSSTLMTRMLLAILFFTLPILRAQVCV